jgi:hypothetical protein
MRQEDERGFLSDKFDDWSGEPIPNGWNSLDSKLSRQKTRQRVLLAAVPLVLLLSFALFRPEFETAVTSLPQSGKKSFAANQISEKKRAAPPEPESTPHDVTENSEKQSLASAPKGSPSRQPSFASYNLPALPPTDIPSRPSAPFTESGIENHPADPTLASAPIGPEPGEAPLSVEAESLIKSNETALLPLALKLALLPEVSLPAPPALVRFPEQNNKSTSFWLAKSITIQAAYAVSDIQLDHARSEGWKYGVRNSQFTQAGFVSAGLSLEKPLGRGMALFYGLDGGYWLRRMELNTSARNAGYEISENGNLSFSVSPSAVPQIEIRTSRMVFARCELGIRKTITRRTGVFASGQFWSRVAVSASSDLHSSSDFKTTSNSFAPGYRLGFWMQTGNSTQVEFSFSSFPEQLAPSTPGIGFNTNALSMSLRQSF